MLNSAFEPWPSFTQAEADAVSKVLLSNKVNYWTGQECREFEKEFAQFAATKHAVAVANGTVALDVALKALGIGAGAMIKQGTPDQPLVIGVGAIVGMGAVVTKSVPAGATVVGNPARIVTKK